MRVKKSIMLGLQPFRRDAEAGRSQVQGLPGYLSKTVSNLKFYFQQDWRYGLVIVYLGSLCVAVSSIPSIQKHRTKPSPTSFGGLWKLAMVREMEECGCRNRSLSHSSHAVSISTLNSTISTRPTHELELARGKPGSREHSGGHGCLSVPLAPHISAVLWVANV